MAVSSHQTMMIMAVSFSQVSSINGQLILNDGAILENSSIYSNTNLYIKWTYHQTEYESCYCCKRKGYRRWAGICKGR